MKVPEGARAVIRLLRGAGFEAYLVGGCVRDALLAETDAGAAPHDWDICTDATPDRMKCVFSDCRTLDTGLKHGTLTVLLPDGAYEVTTFRIDGPYSDGRHPDAVSFTASIEKDLARRDFTINAMAMSPDENGGAAGVVDPFGGREDLARRVLRCVGDPDTRFREDALRILRALRFAGRLSLTIDPATHDAMLAGRELLHHISAERIMDELGKILLTAHGWELLSEYRDILTEIIPELRPCVGCDQHNSWHCYDVFEHILHSVGSAPAELTLRLAMLLHDVEKPAVMTVDEAGVGHFRGHAERSAETAERVLKRLRCSNQLTRDVTGLRRFHDAGITPTASALRRLLGRLGERQTRRLFQVKRADMAAQSERARERKQDALAQCEALLEQILAQRQAFTLKDLAIGGNDLLAAGVAPGPALGARLQKALDAVLDGTCENEREALLKIALK